NSREAIALTFDDAAETIRGLPRDARSKAKDFFRSALLAAGRKLTRADIAVASALMERLNWNDGYCYPGAARIADDTGYSRRHVLSSRKKLAALDIIVTQPFQSEERGHEGLRVTFPPLVKFSSPASEENFTTPSEGGFTPLVKCTS